MKKGDIIFTLLSVLLIGAVLFGISLPRLKRWNQSMACGNRAIAISFGARVWAGDNNHRLPDNFMCMSNELVSPQFVMLCPSDKVRKPAADWGSFTTNNTSYEIIGSNLPDDDFTNAFVRCGIHGNLGYADGTYFDGHSRKAKW